MPDYTIHDPKRVRFKRVCMGVAQLRHRQMARWFMEQSTHPDPVESESVAEVSAISATFRMCEEINEKEGKRAWTVEPKVHPLDGGRLEMSNLSIERYKG
jgi:hypothetical protein